MRLWLLCILLSVCWLPVVGQEESTPTPTPAPTPQKSVLPPPAWA